MNRYEPGVSRIASGMAAVAMTAITIGLLVILPAAESVRQGFVPLAASRVAAPAPAEAAIGPACSDTARL